MRNADRRAAASRGAERFLPLAFRGWAACRPETAATTFVGSKQAIPRAVCDPPKTPSREAFLRIKHYGK